MEMQSKTEFITLMNLLNEVERYGLNMKKAKKLVEKKYEEFQLNKVVNGKDTLWN